MTESQEAEGRGFLSYWSQLIFNNDGNGFLRNVWNDSFNNAASCPRRLEGTVSGSGVGSCAPGNETGGGGGAKIGRETFFE
jgi:hypothetical protein